MKEVDFLIAGQGLCGTLLSYEVLKAGKKCLVVDDGNAASSSRTASGVINPVTGMRLAKAWMIDHLIPKAVETYHALEHLLGMPLLQQIPLIEFFRDDTHATLFTQRAAQYPEYLSADAGALPIPDCFYTATGYGVISAYLLDIHSLLQGWRAFLSSRGMLLQDTFSWQRCLVKPDGILYGDIKAHKMVCCQGAFSSNPFFGQLPFAFNKGQALLAEIPGLPRGFLYHREIKITPWGTGLFWVGSSFEPGYNDVLPTVQFREQTEQQLASWLMLPFRITGHLAAVRPATADRMPICAVHSQYPSLGVLNGMGAKGCSQAPWFAHKLYTLMQV